MRKLFGLLVLSVCAGWASSASAAPISTHIDFSYNSGSIFSDIFGNGSNVCLDLSAVHWRHHQFPCR